MSRRTSCGEPLLIAGRLAGLVEIEPTGQADAAECNPPRLGAAAHRLHRPYCARYHQEMPHDDCTKAPGELSPVVDRARCEAKSACVAACPYNVFEVRRIEPHDYAPLSLLAKLKVRVHGMRTAYTPRADQCHGCGHCVTACPERAISLERR